MPAVLVAVLTVMQNSLHPLSTSSIIACHLKDFMVQGKITEADALTIRLDATPSGLSVPPPPSSPIFMPSALSVATLAIYPGLGQAPNNAGCTPGGLVELAEEKIQVYVGIVFCSLR